MGPAKYLALALLVSTSSVHADDKADKAEADKHYQLGKRHYNLNEWDEAIDEFKTAYKLFPDPVNLFNIAQAYRLKGKNCTAAAQFYANYQREEKNKKLRDSVTKVRKDMEACAATEKPDEPVTAPALPVPVDPQPPPPSPAPIMPGTPTGENAMRPIGPSEPVNPDPNRNRRILGYVAMGGGALLVAFGFGFTAQKNGFQSRLDTCDDFGCERDDDDPVELKDNVERARVNANASFGIGFTSIIVGGFLYMFSRKPTPDQRVTVMPARNGAAVQIRF